MSIDPTFIPPEMTKRKRELYEVTITVRAYVFAYDPLDAEWLAEEKVLVEEPPEIEVELVKQTHYRPMDAHIQRVFHDGDKVINLSNVWPESGNE